MIKRTLVETQIGDVELYARKCPGDREVMKEVLMRDQWGLEALDDSSFVPDLIFDIGANIGCFSALALKFWPESYVTAYEPHPLSFGLLNQNLRKYKNQIDLHLAAVTGRNLPNSFLQISTESATDHPQCWDLNQEAERKIPDPSTQGFCYCNVVDINTLFDSVSTNTNLLVKIDTEGSEFYILEGLRPENYKKISKLLVEIHGSQIAIPDYLQTTWKAVRGIVKDNMSETNLSGRHEINQEQFILRASN